MNKFIVLNINKKIKVLLFVLLFLIIIGLFTYLFYSKKAQIVSLIDINNIEKLEKENTNLKETLDSFFPDKQQVLYESCHRPDYPFVEKPSISTVPLKDVVTKGKNIKFKSYSDQDYMRPIYDSTWRDFYFRGWINVPHKLKEARHRLFLYPFGGSAGFDFQGSLGFKGKFDKGVSVDFHRNINFLVFDFEVKYIKLYNNQVALIGKPKKAGAQIINIVQNDLLSDDAKEKDFLFQLSTPGGYEIDYIYGNAIEYEYLWKKIKEHTVMTSKPEEERTVAQLKAENAVLRKELSYYIPIDDDIRILKEECRTKDIEDFPIKLDINTIITKGISVPFHLNYSNASYKRPVYHPTWQKHVNRGWTYIPSKICLNLHNIFTISKNERKAFDLFGQLAFFENYEQIGENNLGLLIYNFNVKKVFIKDNQIVVLGTPCRSGSQIISLDENLVPWEGDYIIHLATPDKMEIDFDVLSGY